MMEDKYLKAFNKGLKTGREQQEAKIKYLRNQIIEEIKESHLNKDNHKIGIELESYVNVLEYRGLKKEAEQLLEIASRLK